MKRVLSILLVLAMIFVLAACSSKSEPIDYTGTYDVVKIEAGDSSASASRSRFSNLFSIAVSSS